MTTGPNHDDSVYQESTIPSSCLTSEGELTITATPGVRFRLLLKAILPVQCPARETQDYCPQVSHPPLTGHPGPLLWRGGVLL